MPTRAQNLRLSIFIAVSFIALLGLIGVITRQQLLKESDIYYIAYEDLSVGGLEVGSSVKYLGIKVGVVDDVRIDPQNVARVIITVKLTHGTPIKTDSRADISSIGITGLKTIEIRGGSNAAERLKPGSYIQAGTSLSEEITDRADVMTRKLDQILNNLQAFTRPDNLNKFTHLAEQAGAAFEKMNGILDENRRNMRVTLETSQQIAARLDSAAVLLHATLQDVHRIARSDTLEQILANTQAISAKLKEANLVALIGELRTVVEHTSQMLSLMDRGLERGGRDFIASMERLKLTSEYLEEVSRMLQSDPSLLLRGAKTRNIPDKNLER